MAKAEGKSTTPIDERTVGECSDAELNAMMQQALEEDFRNRPEFWAAERAKAIKSKKASKRLGRAIAIQMGLVAPPWVGELMAQLKPSATPDTILDGFVSNKLWVAREVDRMKAAGEIPAGVTKADLAKELAQRMVRAHETNRSIRPIKGTSIKSNLLVGDLWKSIK